jgi:hypothetical protein
MNLYQRTRHVLRHQGLTGLVSRLVRNERATPTAAAPPSWFEAMVEDLKSQMPRLKAEYEPWAAAFPQQVQALGLGDVSRYYWYHTVDLGRGLVTPGDYDFRGDMHRFPFPSDMHGQTALDVGSATGFFSFELEKRGADVTAVELPSLGVWDMPLDGEGEQIVERLRCYHQAATAAEAYHLHLNGPFQFCKSVLGSRVRRCYSSVYDLKPAVLGCDAFDLVFVGDMLLHLMSPLKALAVLAPLCRKTMVLTQQLADEDNPTPQALYIGGDAPNDGRAWWLPNWACFQQMLRRLGFRDVRIVDHITGVSRREWGMYYRAIIEASK